MKHSKKFWKQLTTAVDSVEGMLVTINKVWEEIGEGASTPQNLRDELMAVYKRLEVIGDEFYDLEQDIDGGE